MEPETRAIQDDDTANPGMLWVLDGEALWKPEDGAAGRACADCHDDARTDERCRRPLSGVRRGARPPRRARAADRRLPRAIGSRRPRSPTRAASCSRSPRTSRASRAACRSTMAVDARTQPFDAGGGPPLHRRQGQLNLACSQCHDDNWGRRLAGSAITQAHPTGYPLNAKLILVGDDRQLSSIDRGGMFAALKDRHGAAELAEVKRQHKIDERRAAEMMAEGNFHDALNIYDSKGAIHWTRTQGEARAELIEQWAKDSAAAAGENPFRIRLHECRCCDSSMPPCAMCASSAASWARITSCDRPRPACLRRRRPHPVHGDRQEAPASSTARPARLSASRAAASGQARRPAGQGASISTAASFDKFRHGYAGTIYKGQGRTSIKLTSTIRSIGARPRATSP